MLARLWAKYFLLRKTLPVQRDENTSHKIASHNEDDQESYRKVENQQKFEKKWTQEEEKKNWRMLSV